VARTHRINGPQSLVDDLAETCEVALTHLSGKATKFSEREPKVVRFQLERVLARYWKETASVSAD